MLALPASFAFGGVVTVASDSVISNSISTASIYLTSAVHGSGKLTLKGLNSTADNVLLASSSTWTGDWDVADGVQLRFAGTSYSIPRGIRVGSRATAHYKASTTIKGTMSGSGTNKVLTSGTVTIGSATNQGKVSPGDSGAGNLTLTSYSSGNYGPTLAFSSNSVYEVEVTGTSTCDRVTVVGTGTGVGKVTIAAGAALNVTLWTPAGNATLDAKIVDTVKGNGTAGTLTGSFSKTNWSNTNGWTGLVVTNIGNDLFVKGQYTSGGKGVTSSSVTGGSRTGSPKQSVAVASTAVEPVAEEAGVAAPVKVTAMCKRGGLVLVSWPMVTEAGVEVRTKDVLGGQGLPVGTVASHWDVVKGVYETDVLDEAGVWGANVVWKRGAGYWIAVPEGASEADYGINLGGVAPADETFSLTIELGENQLGYPYAADVLWVGTTLAREAMPGDTVRVWDAEASEYITNVKGEDGTWSDPAMTIKVGEGFWFKTALPAFESLEKAVK
jgi:hypothetical protein